MIENPIVFFICMVIIALAVLVFVHLLLAAVEVFIVLLDFLLRLLNIPFAIRGQANHSNAEAAAHVVAFVFSAVGENISLDTMKRPNEKDMTVGAKNSLRTKHVRNSAQRFVRIETSYLLVR